MPAVFIHGVPDTFHVWDGVRSHLARTDAVALALPGFASSLPKGFQSTKDEYVDWIVGQLERQREPVDLVGHDWGCLLTVRVASIRPDLVRTWAAGSGPLNRDYEWHELAKVFQTPDVGERWMAELDRGEFAKRMEDAGFPAHLAVATAERMDETMKASILRLYRSAVYVGREWVPDLVKVIAPGLVFWGVADPFCPIAFADRLGQDTKASRVLKLECGHWTPIQKPAEVARALEQHWIAGNSKEDD